MESGRRATSFRGFWVAAAFAGVAVLVGGAAAQGDSFCRSVVASLTRCAGAAPVDSVNLSNYEGKWYEIGTNAQFAFSLFGQQGGQCVTAKYTPLGQEKGKNKIRVENKALGVASLLRQGQALAVSAGAGASGLGVRFLCQFLVGNLPLSLAFPNLRAVKLMGNRFNGMRMSAGQRSSLRMVQRLSLLSPKALTLPSSVANFAGNIGALAANNFLLTPVQNASLSAELDKIYAAIASASDRAAQIFAALEIIQAKNFVLTGGNGSGSYNVFDISREIQAQATKIQGLAVGVMADRDQIMNSAMAIQLVVGPVAPLIFASAYALFYITDPRGPFGIVSAGIGAGAVAVSGAALTVLPEAPRSRDIKINGTATQSLKNNGALEVKFFNRFTAPYHIIRLEGSPSSGYDTAVVYSCTDGILSAFIPQNSAYLLARTPTVTDQVLNSAQEFLKAKGILLAGDNSFLKVSQDPSICTHL